MNTEAHVIQKIRHGLFFKALVGGNEREWRKFYNEYYAMSHSFMLLDWNFLGIYQYSYVLYVLLPSHAFLFSRRSIF
jgi:hypothetical protein